MATANADAYRFIPTADLLDDLFCRYEDARRSCGIATTLARVSPQQRIDAIVTMLGLNTAAGWRRKEDESAEDLWLRYLTPVLAETRECAAALDITARQGLPGVFTPPISSAQLEETVGHDNWEPDLADDLQSTSHWRRRVALAAERGRALLEDRRAVTGVLGIAILCTATIAWLLIPGPLVPNPEPVDPSPVIKHRVPDPVVSRGSNPTPGAISNEVSEDYRDAQALTLVAVKQSTSSITPRRLAEVYAAESRSIGEPAAFLSAMFHEWPLPPDLPISRDRPGAFALIRYAETFAALQRQEPVAPVRTPLDRDTAEDQELRDAVTAFADGADTQRPDTASTDGWMAWLRLVTFLPLFPVFLWMRFKALPAFKAQLVNPRSGERGVAVDLPVEGLILTAPPPARRLARQISWREPGTARRIHAEASVRATIHRGGFLTMVPRRRRRPADYVFLVPRRRRDDHERDRVSRFIDALKRGGLALTVYDYDPDPRTLYPRSINDMPGDGHFGGALDLRALRELHSEARLVLVTDGVEMVDYFQRPLPFVAEELTFWSARMLLTPVPMAEWGEREMNIADALGAIIGRATPEGFHDLETAFGDRSPQLARAPVSVEAVVSDRGLLTRLRAWLDSAERLLGGHDDVSRRPATLRFDDPILYSDAAPPEAEQAELIEELRTWLGPRGYLWLVACSAYPQLRFAITLYLGLKITIERGPVAEPLYDERILAQLTLLPWFRIGRMPPWLRYALFATLPEFSRQRVRTAIAEMLNSSTLDIEQLPPEALLSIWRPDETGADAPPDAVMADLMFRDMAEVSPILQGGAFSAIFQNALHRARQSRIMLLGATFLWCAAACWLWPQLGGAPHASGIWLPLIAFLGVTAMVAILIAVGLVWRRHSPLSTIQWGAET